MCVETLELEAMIMMQGKRILERGTHLYGKAYGQIHGKINNF